MMTGLLLAAAVVLQGVTGSVLRARAYFDANNVKVGDQLTLTVDFIGEANFEDIHPPRLSKFVDREDWRLDDVSAKTATSRNRRRLTYRIFPQREGVVWFPSLSFEYRGPDGRPRSAVANAIPVHAKNGGKIEIGEAGEDCGEMPKPPELIAEWGGDAESAGANDERFAWRKAMARPTADAFAGFDFPAAKMNEATCAIREGNWVRALKVYQKLEWRIGQTKEIERGIVAALALRYENPSAELPVWRQLLRPVLRHAWPGRVGIVVGGFTALALLFWILGRGIRALACLAAAVGLAASANAQDVFQQMEAQMQRMRQQMNRQMQSFGNGGFSFSLGGQEGRDPVKVTARLTADKKELQVGDPFAFIVSLEYPKTSSVGQIRLTPSETTGLVFTGPAQNLTDGKAVDTNNCVSRIALPARYDVPFKGRLSFSIEGMVSGRETRRGGMFSFSFSNSFRTDTQPLTVDVRPLPGQPPDFSGIVSEDLRVRETCDVVKVETNDVVTISYRLFPRGYVPADFLPKEAAFEWGRSVDREGRVAEIEYKRYFVADGAAKTPELSISYYDPRTKTYRFAKAGGTPLKYVLTNQK